MLLPIASSIYFLTLITVAATTVVAAAIEPGFKCLRGLAVLVALGLNCSKHYSKDCYPSSLLHFLEELGFVDFHWRHFGKA